MDIAELRFDLFRSFDLARARATIKMFAGIPVILTVRSKKEGGKWNKTEDERLAIYRELISEVDAVDIELNSNIREQVSAIADQRHKTKILSFHDFSSTPPLATIENLKTLAKPVNNTIFKISAKINRRADLLVLTRFLLNNPDENLAVIGMGSVAGRVVLPLYGSVLTFASLNTVTAPGQLRLAETSSLLKSLSS